MTPLRAACFTFAAALAATAPAARAQTTPPPAKDEAPLSRDLRSKIFVLQHRTARALNLSLLPLLSGAKGSTLIANESLNTLTVRDFPENIAAIEAAIQRLDLASPAQKEVEYHIHVLFASKTEGASGSFPEELKEVLAPLKSALSYRSYTPAASFVQRAQADTEHLEGSGQADLTSILASGAKQTLPITFRWKIRRTTLDRTTAGSTRIALTDFELGVVESVKDRQEMVAQVRTDLSLKDGDKVVVGTTALHDRGLIVVLTAKVME